MGKPVASLRLVKASLSDQAYEELKRQILDRQLAPGARLSIDALSRAHGISSSPLREALIRLQAESLVIFTNNAGFAVAPVPDAARMEELLDYRLLLEAFCARQGAARGDVAAIAAMEAATEGMATMRRRGVGYRQSRAYLDLEQQFHQALVDSAGNRPIAAAYRELHLILLVARMSIVPASGIVGSDDAVREHRAIIAAFKAGDGVAAEAALREHIAAARARLRGGETGTDTLEARL